MSYASYEQEYLDQERYQIERENERKRINLAQSKARNQVVSTEIDTFKVHANTFVAKFDAEMNTGCTSQETRQHFTLSEADIEEAKSSWSSKWTPIAYQLTQEQK